MTWKYIFEEAVASMRYYRRRTVVTVLSLGWGVACFVLLMSYGDGFETAITKAFHAVGQDLILTWGGQTSQQAGGLRSGHSIRLDYSDAVMLKETQTLIGAISPESMLDVKVMRGQREREGYVRAVWPEYDVIRNIHLLEGRWINRLDDDQRHRVAVIGSKVAKELFAGAPAVDEEITLNGVRFTVIGVLDMKLQTANYSHYDNECIFIPYQTIGIFRDWQYPNMLVWMPVTPLSRDAAIRGVREALAITHHCSPTDEKAIEILAFSKFMNLITGMALAVKALLGFVGTLTLAIGGVGLANIMLCSVLDRTREIGVLKALGAYRRHIRRQFLVEATSIVAMGGALGVALGAAAAFLVGSMPFLGPIFEDTSGNGDIHLSLSPTAIAVSLGVLLLVGLIAGTVPAIKAAKLDPIESLRYE